jgi:HSP20 family protein
MVKKSFFEKLTGSAKMEEEAVEPKKVDYGEEPPQKEKERVKTEENPAAPAAWSGEEAEGQLTIDVYQTPAEIVIQSTIAGVEPENLDIAITNDMITIRGRRQKQEEVKGEDYFYQECYWGNFSRSVILPVDIDADKAVASLKNGILTIRLPKAEKIRTKKIKIKTE